MSNDEILVRIDGIMGGVSGPLTLPVGRRSIAEIMGWTDSGRAVEVMTRTLDLLAQGKAVRLTGRQGYADFQPLAESEDGRLIPASASTIYGPDGSVIQRSIPA